MRDSVQMKIIRIQGQESEIESDAVVVEEPLEIRIVHGPSHNRQRFTATVTMRTPGSDPELALGFLFAEGLVSELNDIVNVDTSLLSENILRVDLHPGLPVELRRLERQFPSTSSCGLCGKSCLEAIEARLESSIPAGPLVSATLFHELPNRLRKRQAQFACSGGLHAAALFHSDGSFIQLHEDIGRHNALDKLTGASLLAQQLPWHDRILLLSGRASFELIQKAVVVGVPIVAAVGAPSSLAVELAQRCGMTLLGFVREQRFNIYSGEYRIQLD